MTRYHHLRTADGRDVPLWPIPETKVEPDGTRVSNGPGLAIRWQSQLWRGRYQDPPEEPSGAFVQTVLLAAIDQLRHYQIGPYPSPHNARAIEHVLKAIDELRARAEDRANRGVLGMDEP